MSWVEGRKKVIGHYDPNYCPQTTLKYDQWQRWLDSGHVVDRPFPSPHKGEDWLQRDMEDEVRRFRAAGLDAVQINFQQAPTDGRTLRAVELAYACERLGFQVILGADCQTGADAHLPWLLETLGSLDCLYRIGGQVVVMPYDGHKRTDEYWREVRDRQGVRLIPIVQGWYALQDRFSSYCDGIVNWPGGFTPSQKMRRAGDFQIRGYGVLPGWVKPRSKEYREPQGSRLFREHWEAMIGSDDLDWVLTVWNGFDEGSYICPSVRAGDSFSILNALYAHRFRTGQAPRVLSLESFDVPSIRADREQLIGWRNINGWPAIREESIAFTPDQAAWRRSEGTELSVPR